ncbi:MAG: histidine kinase N-terminal 7TM domain-containing protein [Candidatus Omnitrophica bacterium]|nr:histidine kinase N-terminal 7TM domain-containing protein [Candidatus Omnitrophota bacterium]
MGLFVFFNNRRSAINIAFSLFCLALFIWLFGYTVTYSTRSEFLAILFTKIACTSAAFCAPAFYFFISEYLQLRSERRWVAFSYILTLILTPFFIFTSYFMQFPFKYFWGYYSKAGLLHPLLLLIFYTIFCRGYYLLLKNYKRMSAVSALEATRIKYVVIASIVTMFGSVDYIPKYGVEFYPFGFMFEIFFAAIIAYAILRYKLLDIDIVIKNTLVFSALSASIFMILLLPTLIMQEYIFRGASSIARLFGITISGIIIILSMRRIESFLVNITDKYLFQKKYNYKELLKTFTSEVLTVLDLNNLVSLTVNKLLDIIKLNSCAVLLLIDRGRQFDVVASSGVKDLSSTLVSHDGIVTLMKEMHGYILTRQLRDRKIAIPASVQIIIDKLRAELIIPMILHDEVIGVLS